MQMNLPEMVELDATDGDAEHVPYRRLFASVLLQAVRDYDAARRGVVPPINSNYGFSVPKLHSWFVSTSMEVCSFEWICALLDMDAGVLRQRIGIGPYPPRDTSANRKLKGKYKAANGLPELPLRTEARHERHPVEETL
ncbi:hypothetical protein [Paraburkholderia sp. BL10I2N1]|uniref:hypothetical protein n=1 Tax=Paraburkholderia sp. BL10I2N1 TaxID=1938796 RepID=UPI00105D558E|nr:hypothetical protein [Paraburkholderia sp. BL10I2N1]TDN70479.1 hypothetical protein B0G77_3953 [Paraburkholderia sp. BL10I2N1]